MKSFIKQNQISIFFVVTLLLGWFPWYTGRGSILIAAPTIAALLVALLADGWQGILDILRRLGRWRANWGQQSFWWLPRGSLDFRKRFKTSIVF